MIKNSNILKGIIKNKIEINNTIVKLSGFGFFDKKNPQENDNRYYLEINLNDDTSKPVIVVFMINPSKTFPEIECDEKTLPSTIDKTIKNLIKMTYNNYSKLIVLNLFSKINSKPTGLENNKTNDKLIAEFLKNDIKNTDILIACGHNKNINYDKNIKELISPYKNKFNNIFYLSLDIKKFENYIQDKILHPSPSVINAYGGLENLKFENLEFKS